MRPSSASHHGVNDLAIELKTTDPAQLLDPGQIRPTTFAFWSSKVLLIPVELDLSSDTHRAERCGRQRVPTLRVVRPSHPS